MREMNEAVKPQDTDFETTIKLVENDAMASEAMRRRDEMIVRPVSAYADDEPPLDPPTEEDVAARQKWADRHAAVLSAIPPRPSSDGEPSPHIIPDGLKITDWRWWGTGANLDFKQDMSTRKLNIRLPGDPVTIPKQPDTFCDACYDQQQGFGKCPDHIVSSPQPATPTYINPLAALRRERKVKPGKAAKLLGISRQRLHVVEHATKPLRCMDRLLAKAAMVWPVVDETGTTVVVSK